MYESRDNEVWWVPQTPDGAPECLYAACESVGAAMRITELLESDGRRLRAEMDDLLAPVPQ